MTNNGICECTGRTFPFGTRDVNYIEFVEIFAGVAYPLQELNQFGYRIRIEAGARGLGSLKGISTRLQRVKVFYRILIVLLIGCQPSSLSLLLLVPACLRLRSSHSEVFGSLRGRKPENVRSASSPPGNNNSSFCPLSSYQVMVMTMLISVTAVAINAT